MNRNVFLTHNCETGQTFLDSGIPYKSQFVLSYKQSRENINTQNLENKYIFSNRF